MADVLQTFTNKHGSKRTYYLNGNKIMYHGIGYPASIGATGYLIWYVDHVPCSTVKKYCKLCKFDKMTTCIWVLKYGKFLPKHIDEL